MDIIDKSLNKIKYDAHARQRRELITTIKLHSLEEFEYDQSINVEDVKLLMAKCYYAKGYLSDNSAEGTDALYWILQLDPEYGYLNAADPLTWNLYNYGVQDFDSFDEIILIILTVLEREVFSA